MPKADITNLLLQLIENPLLFMVLRCIFEANCQLEQAMFSFLSKRRKPGWMALRMQGGELALAHVLRRSDSRPEVRVCECYVLDDGEASALQRLRSRLCAHACTLLMPDGESLQQVLDRAWPAFARACDGLGEDDTLLVVAHDAVNRVLLCRILGLPIGKLWTFRQAPTTLNLIEGPDVDSLEVVRLNDCAHHTPFFGEARHRAL